MTTVMIERSAEERVGKAVNGSPASLVDRIIAALPKTAGQRLIVRQVGSFNYRANWYDEVDNDNLAKTWRIVDSKFLHVIDQGKSLIIVDRTKR